MVNYPCHDNFVDYIRSHLVSSWLIPHYLSAETVVYRIFYCLNRIGSGYLTLRELKRGNLISALRHADDEEDINKVLRWHLQIKFSDNSAPLYLQICLKSIFFFKGTLSFHYPTHWTSCLFSPVGISHMSISMWYIASSGSWTQTMTSLLTKKILLSMEIMHWHIGL